MTNGVVLTAALRSNLLSLQQTQKDIDVHQNRLATGKKVNSALDNPQAFFAAQALTDRANDLSNLLDSIGQSIQVINAANNGVSALTTLINQAQSIANTAQSTLAGASTTAKTVGSVALNGAALYTSLSGVSTGDKLIIDVTDPNGGTNKLTAATYTVVAGDTINDIVTKINDFNTSNNLTTAAIKASLDDAGHLVFEAVNGGNLSVQFQNNGAVTDAASLSIVSALGYAGIAVANTNGAAAANNITGFTAKASSSVTTNALYTNATGSLAQGSTLLSALKDSAGLAITNITNTADTLKLTVGGKTSADLFLYGGATSTTSTVQSFIDAVNHDANISSLVSASFDATTGKISLTALSSSATDVKVSFTGVAAQSFSLATATYANGLGFGNKALTTAAQTAANETIRFGAAAGTLQSLQTQYNTTLAQIDALVSDTGYAGTNLLKGNNLVTYFNETRTSSLTTSGTTFTSAGLGLTTGNFQSAASITAAINQTIASLTTVRNFGSTLSNNLSIIQNRQDFTNNLINTLKTGSDALTNADQNEEGASLLALQTRQSLGITSLSLASQAQQAILKLF
jgi:flagellin